MKISVEKARDLSVAVFVFVFSIMLGTYYHAGDQRHYIAAYEAVRDTDLLNGFLAYKSHITTEEPVHFLITWFFSAIGIDKLIAMSFSNSLLAFLLIRLIKNIGGAPSVAYVLVLSNYYFMVMYLTAERLKFAFIFLLMAMLAADRPKSRYLLFSFSILSHMQMLILFIAREFERIVLAVSKVFLRFSISKMFIFYLVALIFTFFLFYIYFGDYLLWKVPQYMSDSGLNSIWQVTLFMLMSLIHVKKRGRVALFFFPIVAASFVVGPERVVIIAYFVFLYHAIQNKHGLNYSVGLTTLYFGLKSIVFILNIFNTGQGFSDSVPE